MKTAKFLCAAAIAALTALVSCKKENEDPVVVPDPELTSFKFELANNPEAISSDIEGVISGDAVTVSMMKAADKSRLVATFTANEGDVVKVGDVVQVSGKTVNDFTNPVDYIVTNSDGGKSALYSVSITSVNGKLEPLVTYSSLPVSDAVLRVNPDNKAPYLAFKEKSVTGSESASADKLTVVNFLDGAWNLVGSAGFSNKVASSVPSLPFDFDVDSKGGLYVAYADNEASPKSAKVMGYSGGSWSLVGSGAANNFMAQNLSLAALSDNNLVLLQKCNSKSDPFKRHDLVVSLYNGSWNSNTVLDITSMAAVKTCKAGNTAYAFVIRRGKPCPHDVLKYVDGTWTALRTNFVREGATQTGNFVYDITATEDGTVYLLTVDDAQTTSEYRIIVEKYSPEAGSWSIVSGGYYPFVSGDAHDVAKLAVAPDGTPYMLYYDYKNTTLRLTWFDSDTKQWAEPVVVATEALSSPCIAFAASGVGYIAFTDANNAEKVFIYR